MSLSYTETVVERRAVTQNVQVPNKEDFSCYNSAGNRALQGHAKTFLTKIEKIMADTDQPFSKRRERCRKAILAYFRTYRRFSNTDTGMESGAGDSAVREVVRWFAERVAKAVDIDTSTVDNLWEESYE